MPETEKTFRKVKIPTISETIAIPKYLAALDFLLMGAILAFASFKLYFFVFQYKLDTVGVAQYFHDGRW